MSITLLRVSRLIRPSRPLTPLSSTSMQHQHRAFTTTRPISTIVDSSFLSRITAAEKELTKQDDPVKNGPTARAQSHVGHQLTAQVVHDITLGERSITGQDRPIQGGPASIAQSILTQDSGTTNGDAGGGAKPSEILDSDTISQITEKEKQITGQEDLVKGGPMARAQQHASENITSQALHDITEGEKKVTGGERIKGGPTAAAQRALGRSRA